MSNPPSWNHVKAVFQAVVERPADERAAVLQTLCAGDLDLQAEVEALLDAHAQAASLGERPVLEWLSSVPVGSRDVAVEPPLPPGERLGPYEIESQLGAGGMGVVYRARDTRLGRTVAIKVLPAHLRVEDARYQRLEREARAIATLDHPHICALYDVGQDRGQPFLVMQYLEGDTLAARLAKGPQLPIDQALRYAVEIADALDHAHRRGIIHRDLKPSNVMLTKSGATLLDFGIAKWRMPPADPPASGASESPRNLTGSGMILGTVQYMAPEQLEGKEVDGRTDIFAFGAVVYEMTTGRRAFAADTQAGVVAAVMASDPGPVSAMRTGVRSLDRTVRKCLAKDPDARWQTARDLADELNWIMDGRTESPGPPRTSAPSVFRPVHWWLLASLLSVLAAGATWVLKPTTPTASLPAARFTVELPPGAVLVPVSYAPTLALSPDGRHLVYAAVAKGATQLFVRAMDDVESRAIDGTSGAEEPFFSPDSRWVGFVSGETVKRVALSGGTPITAASGVTPVGASWGPNDHVVLGGWREGLSVVAASGGPLREITTLDAAQEQSSHRHPELLPGGRAVIFTAGPPASGLWYDAEIVAQSLETGERHVVIRGGAQAHYVSTGHLVYARAGTLYAVPFDVKILRATGPPVAVLEGVAEDQATGASQFTVSASGPLAYIPGGLQKTDVVWVDRRGHADPLIVGQPPRLYYQPRLSPDGRQLAISVASADDDIWVYDLGRETLSRFTSGATNIFPGWTPDGRYITFVRSDDLLRRPADRSAPEEAILTGLSGVPHSWSPDGRLLTFTRSRDIWTIRTEDRARQPLLQTPFAELTPMISPDGRWLAYTSDETGRFEIYLQPLLGAGARAQISRDGGTEPLWARNGKELFYRQDDSLMAVAVANGAALARPQLLFSEPWWGPRYLNRTNYDVAPDGQRFVMLRREPQVRRIQVVLNWADELSRRVPR